MLSSWYFKFITFVAGIGSSVQLLPAARPSLACKPSVTATPWSECECSWSGGPRCISEHTRSGTHQFVKECTDKSSPCYFPEPARPVWAGFGLEQTSGTGSNTATWSGVSVCVQKSTDSLASHTKTGLACTSVVGSHWKWDPEYCAWVYECFGPVTVATSGGECTADTGRGLTEWSSQARNAGPTRQPPTDFGWKVFEGRATTQTAESSWESAGAAWDRAPKGQRAIDTPRPQPQPTEQYRTQRARQQQVQYKNLLLLKIHVYRLVEIKLVVTTTVTTKQQSVSFTIIILGSYWNHENQFHRF